MSGEGRPEAGPDATGLNTTGLDAKGLRIPIVAGRWNAEIADGLIAGAQRLLEAAGASSELIRVDGAFELPVVAKAVLDAGADAVVALGVIIRGGTPHFDFVSDAATSGLTRVALDTGKPVGFGVLTLDDEQQGRDRAGLPGSKEDKGAEAAHAAITSALTLRELRTRRSSSPTFSRNGGSPAA